MSFDGGIWSYMASTGASTHVILPTQKLLSLRAFANGADGTLQFTTNSVTTSGGSVGPSVVIRTGTGFDWTPAGKVTRCVFVTSSSIDLFYELSS